MAKWRPLGPFPVSRGAVLFTTYNYGLYLLLCIYFSYLPTRCAYGRNNVIKNQTRSIIIYIIRLLVIPPSNHHRIPNMVSIYIYGLYLYCTLILLLYLYIIVGVHKYAKNPVDHLKRMKIIMKYVKTNNKKEKYITNT